MIFLVACPVLAIGGGYLLRPHLDPAHAFLGLLAFFFTVGLLALALAVMPLGRINALRALGFRPVGWRPLVLGVLGTLALSVAVSQSGLQPEGMKQAMNVSREPSQFVAALLVIAVLAPLVEELVFRGLFYGWLEGCWNSGVALIVSSLAFAAAHFEPSHILLVLPLGLFFGYLRRRTDSILPSLVSHMVNNGFAIVAAAFIAP